MSTEIVRAEPAGALTQQMDPLALLARAIDKGSDVETMERLVALAERMQASTARTAFATALASFQEQCPEIRRNRVNTFLGSRYASLGHIIRTTRPLLSSLGLTATFRTTMLDGPLRASTECIVTHTLGHSESSGAVEIPVQQAGAGEVNERGNVKGANPAQRVGIAVQYSRRYAYTNVLGLNAEDDTDGARGGPDRAPAASGPAESSASPAAEGAISENKVRMFGALTRGKWSEEQVHDLLAGYKCNTVAEIQVRDWDAIVEKLKAGPAA